MTGMISVNGTLTELSSAAYTTGNRKITPIITLAMTSPVKIVLVTTNDCDFKSSYALLLYPVGYCNYFWTLQLFCLDLVQKQKRIDDLDPTKKVRIIIITNMQPLLSAYYSKTQMIFTRTFSPPQIDVEQRFRKYSENVNIEISYD